MHAAARLEVFYHTITGMQYTELQMKGAGLVVAAAGDAVRRPGQNHTVSHKPVGSESVWYR